MKTHEFINLFFPESERAEVSWHWGAAETVWRADSAQGWAQVGQIDAHKYDLYVNKLNYGESSEPM